VYAQRGDNGADCDCGDLDTKKSPKTVGEEHNTDVDQIDPGGDVGNGVKQPARLCLKGSAPPPLSDDCHRFKLRRFDFAFAFSRLDS
jgi:hypothetical protein